MKVGLIARSEDRGLGIQSWEWARAMNPDRVLLIDGSTMQVAYPQHPERFPRATTVRLEPGWPEREVREWLDGLDVVYAVETLYDWRLATWAAEQGVATVVHANPEFYRHHREPLARPTAWWLPTSWRAERYPDDAIVVPVPVPMDRWPEPTAQRGGVWTWHHPVGHRAMADRNGTQLVLNALRYLNAAQDVIFTAQEPRFAGRIERQPHVGVDVRVGGHGDYWTAYTHSALVLPRRYGGLCLPVLEASGAGCGVLMSDASPQRDDWPHVATVHAEPAARKIEAQTGPIALWNVDPRALAARMDLIARDGEHQAVMQDRAREWAEAHAWSVLAPEYVRLLEEAAERC